ncbi:MAG: RHS repeat-associated core domain-containing protein [Rhizomicrobium sp.]
MPVALVDHSTGSATLYYIHTDHLNRPQKITDASATIVWDGAFDPFGNAASVTGTLTNPLRFPGQYQDTETNLAQNWFRDYDSTIGRYIESDPIGLIGGINLYAYAGNNPLTRLDIQGLVTLQIGFAGSLSLPFGFIVPLGVGIAVDTCGNVGFYSYGGGGGQFGAEAEAGLSIQASNARTISDLTQLFYNASLHGGAGYGGSADYFWGNSAYGPVVGGGVTLGAAAGASVAGGGTYTWLYAPFGDGSTPATSRGHTGCQTGQCSRK